MKKNSMRYWFMAALSMLMLPTTACDNTKDPGEDKPVCEKTTLNCSDKKDNDCDGRIDCADPDCFEDAACKTPTPGPIDGDSDDECQPSKEICDDNKDNDCDGVIDCADVDCANEDVCKAAPKDLCEDNECKEDEDCNPVDGSCVKTETNPCANKVCPDDNTICDMSNGECVCANDFVKEGSSCIHEKMVPCDSEKLPNGAIPSNTSVTVTYSSATQSWSAPAICDFTCDEDYVKKSGTCVLKEPEVDDGTCKPVDGKYYHKEGDVCVRDITFKNGNAGAHVYIANNGTKIEAKVGESFNVEGSFTTATAYPSEFRNVDGRCPGVLAQLCYEKDGKAGTATKFEDLECVDASYVRDDNGFDVYSASIKYTKEGDYSLFYKWSGDGAATWHYSDANAVRASWQAAKDKEEIYGAYASVTEEEVVVFDGLSYSMDFDSLGKAQGNWTDDSTIKNWYVTSYQSKSPAGWVDVTGYNSSNGSSSVGGLLNLGSQNATDRALGSVSTTSSQIALYLILENTTNKDLSKWTVSYKGEQWRQGKNNDATLAGKYEFSYGVLSTKPTSITDGSTISTTEEASLDFNAPIAGQNITNLPALDGNAEKNSKNISGTFNATVKKGEYILLKWNDPRENGENSMLGIDDVVVIGE